MTSREQFGPYLLLKKLAEDALGETFRAGKVEGQTIEQVLLLRVFDGQGLDGGQLWQEVAERGAKIQQGVKSPNIGNGTDFGEMEGVPFVAYEYISGTDVASLMTQADKQMSPLPVDHALLITERVALGLAAAYEARLGDQRILHGFVVPDLVMISSEGEARLLGLEVGAGLRALAPMSPAVRSFSRYLAPEALEGKPAHKSDDVYSLGILLFELLTGKPAPEGSAEATAALHSALVAHDDEPIPAPIIQLLEKSLAPREQRIGDPVAWHKQLSQLMIEGQYNPTTFNLAFFMHSLFRDEIERENREMASERNLEAQAKTMAIPILSPGDGEKSGAVELEGAGAPAAPEPAEPAKKGKAGLLAAAAVVLALIAAGAYYFFMVRGQGEVTDVAETTDPAAQQALPTGPTQEEIQADLDRLQEEMATALEEKSKAMEQQLAEQYEGRLRELENEYNRQQAVLAEKKRQEQEAEETRKAAALAEQKRRDEEAARLAEEEAQKAAEAAKPKPKDQVAQIQNAPPPPPPVAKPAPPPEPKVKVGELVQPGPGVVPPQILKQVKPTFPPAARRFLRKDTTVVVRVLVDERGRVTEAEREGEKAGMGLDEAAIDAAKQFQFKPATKQGVPVKMWHSLRFAFGAG
jgi:TonB family protein